jgi:quaternary ammonium compound-resistance protein SugE
MAWLILIVAGLIETAWAVGLKYTDGLTRFWPSVFTVVGIVTSIVLLSISVRTLPIGTAYAVWVGIGAAGTALIGILLLGESANPGRLCFLLLLVIAIIGLKMTSQH